jgi:antagonist of KipI
MTSIVVTRAGLMTTVQDLGRWGYQAMGVPVSGPMDQSSHRIANRFAGNREDAATLELTLVGMGLTVRGTGCLAVAGADCTVLVDGRSHETPCALVAEDGAAVDIGPSRRGARAYVAFEGGVSTVPVLGSRATDLRSGLGGLNGRALALGDELPIGPMVVGKASAAADRPGLDYPSIRRRLPTVAETTTLRVVPGPQAGGVLEPLCSAALTVTPRCDRVGYRLAADRRVTSMQGDMLSQPTTMGSVQVAPSGEVLLLMADRQPTGGYAQVAVVITADLPVAGQLVPGCRVVFQRCSEQDARRAWLEEEMALGIGDPWY